MRFAESDMNFESESLQILKYFKILVESRVEKFGKTVESEDFWDRTTARARRQDFLKTHKSHV